MNLDINIDVILNSNPTSPASEFVVKIPLDEDVPEPLPNTHSQVPVLAPLNNLESESSESDLSSYSFNYESDSSAPANGPIYPILPLVNYHDDQDNPEDDINWVKMTEDDVWCVPSLPLLRPGGQHNIISSRQQPENFFDTLFDEAMWTTIVNETNRYAGAKKQQFGSCPTTSIEHPHYKRFSRLNVWKEITEEELKVFFANILLMGILRKSKIEKYWNTSGSWADSYLRPVDVQKPFYSHLIKLTHIQ